LVRTLPCHGRGRGFESRRPRHFSQALARNWRFASWSNLVQLGQCFSLVEHHPNNFALRQPLVRHTRLSVKIQRNATVRMTQELLHHLHFLVVLSQQSCVRVPERVETNPLLDLRRLHCRSSVSSPKGFWPERNLMSALFSHAIRWEWTERNPIKSVRQSAKRMRTPDVLTPDEIMALLKELPEPLRTAAELDAFTGLRRGELIGLQWEDVDFENLVIHVRRSVVMMVQGAPKTEASAKDVPLDAALAESLLKLRLIGPYNRETDWVFASPTMKGILLQPVLQLNAR